VANQVVDKDKTMRIKLIQSVVVSIAVVNLFMSTSSMAQKSGYTPVEVYSVMHAAIRDTFGLQDDKSGDVWLSLSTVGAVVATDDAAQVNDLADFCPAPKPIIDAFARAPRLDAVYEQVINNLVGPQKDYTPAYYAAKAVLYSNGKKTPQYQKYLEKAQAHLTAFKEVGAAKNSGERSQAVKDMNDADRAWSVEGYKAEIDKALSTMSTEEYRTGFSSQRKRIDTLNGYRSIAISGTDAIYGAFSSPQSTFSPAAATWTTSNAGWVSVGYDSTQLEKRYSKEESESRGFGGLSLGFLNLVGSGADRGKVEHKIDNVYKLSYSYDVLRVQIRRPWLDDAVLLQPFDWTWVKSKATKEFPYISVARDASSLQPMASPTSTYDNKNIGCALLPVEFVVAKNRKATATVSKDDYQLIEKSGHRSGGGSLFGIFGGGGSSSWSSVKTSEDATTVTFTVQSDGVAVIGVISQILPVAPQPNPASSWGATAWLPTNATK
jgi:hypothetical protein